MNKYLIIPIKIYSGIVELKNKSKLSTLHRLILELASITDNLDEIINFFNIDSRFIQEVIIDLMIKNLLFVDLESNLVSLRPDILNYIDRGNLDILFGEEFVENKELKWVQDDSTGQIILLDDLVNFMRRPKFISNEDQLILKKTEFVHISKVSNNILIKTAKMALRNFIFEGTIQEQVNRVTNIELIGSTNIYIPLVPKKFQFLGNAPIYIPEAEPISSQTLDIWLKSITGLNEYKISDLTEVDDDYLIKYSWKINIDRIHSIISKLNPIFVNNYQGEKIRNYLRNKINDLTITINSQILPMILELGSSVGETNTFFGKGDYLLNLFEQAIEKAKYLIVIASAFVNEVGLSRIIPILDKQPNIKNLKVLLLWGCLEKKVQS
jgi:hypothetical protein